MQRLLFNEIYMKKLLSIITIVLILASCDPPRNCTKPSCLYSDAKTDLFFTLTGKTDSVIHIGDTIRLKCKLPDTLKTNYGDIIFGSLLGNSFLQYIKIFLILLPIQVQLILLQFREVMLSLTTQQEILMNGHQVGIELPKVLKFFLSQMRKVNVP
jgi:hypothetical protein